MKHITLILALFAALGASAQQVNPVPDYVFANRMSAGRNTVTDTAAYFSIGPRYGATRGMMPPMVVDTASFSANKRNGLLIFSVQKNKFLYWDSVGVKWAEMAGTGGSAITGSGVAGYMPEFTTTTNLDTTRLYHSAGRFAIGSTTTTNGVFNVYGGQSYFDTSLKVGSQTFLADEGKNEIYVNTTTDLGDWNIQLSGNQWVSGNLSVGTTGGVTSNLHKLEVETSNPTRGILSYLSNGASSSQTGSQLTFHQGSVAYWSIGQPAATNAFAIWEGRYRSADGTQLLRLESNGNLSLGQATMQWTAVGRKSIEFNGTSQVLIGMNINGAQSGYIWQNGNDMSIQAPSSGYVQLGSGGTSANRLRLTSSGEVLINTESDAGDYRFQVAGNIYNTGSLTTGAPSGGSIKPWKIGEAATVSPTSPNRTLRVEVDGVVYYIHAKTTND